MPVEWALCIVVQIFMKRGYIRNCRSYRAMKLLKQRMKVVGRELNKGFIE